MTPEEFGERRHEKCRYGRLTQAWSCPVDGDLDNMTPFVMPLCTYVPPEPLPPALVRGWGGRLESYARDCALCERFTEVSATPNTGEQG